MSAFKIGSLRLSAFVCLVCALQLMALPLMAIANPATVDSGISLKWVVRDFVQDKSGDYAKTKSELVLTNQSIKPLPAQGWSLYFTCIAGVEASAATGPILIEQVSGTLFRIRPAKGFQEVGAGGTVRLEMVHAEVMLKSDKAPQSPYLVYDQTPDEAHAIADFQIDSTLPASALMRLTKSPYVSAESIFENNAKISDMPERELGDILPSPLKLELRSGVLRLDAMPAIQGAVRLRTEVNLAKAILAPHFRSGVPKVGTPVVRLAISPVAENMSPEAYQLTIDPVEGVLLHGNSAAGVFRGLQSLRQLLPIHAKPESALELPAQRVVDAPRFEYRGVLLDVARNFHNKETVFRLLDLMSRYKLNKLHFHLTDDEGWRLEIPGLPELTSFGARRGHAADESRHLLPGHGSGPSLTDAHGSGYYSAKDFIDILRFAAERHIDVIPEIEMPGHARAAVKAMESRTRALKLISGADANAYVLNDPEDLSRYRSAQLYSDNVMNPGLPSTYRFIAKVVAEVVSMYRRAGVPLRTIHVGADELANGAWEKSPACIALMKRQGFASTADVWDYFYDRVDQILKLHGLHASGWEELGARKTTLHGKPKLIPNPAFALRGFELFVWNNLDGSEDLAYRLANAGYRVVLAPATHLYFDMAHNHDPAEAGVNWAAYVDLDKMYDFLPTDFLRVSPTNPTEKVGLDGLTDYGKRNVIGLEGTLFSETMREPSRIDYLLMPRMLALAERAWAAEPDWSDVADLKKAEKLHTKDWSRFANLLGKKVLPRLDIEHPDFNYRIPPPGLKLLDGQVHVNHQLPGFTLRYTMDGSEPTLQSTEAQETILGSRGEVRVAAFARSGRRGRSSVITVP